jgi:uncharacterized membrane protein YsdA (DUF1294 family)
MAKKAEVPMRGTDTFRHAAIGTFWWIALGLLLALPVMALTHLSSTVDWKLLAGVSLIVSLATLLAYRSDKRSAQSGGWRVSEATLHVMELIGGWPGALLGQRRYRHKTSKLSFQIVFWLIVLLHELVALDYLLRWAFLGGTLRVIRTHTG